MYFETLNFPLFGLNTNVTLTSDKCLVLYLRLNRITLNQESCTDKTRYNRMDNWIYSRDFPRGGMGITQIGLGIVWIFSTMNTMILPSQDLYSLLQTSEPHSRDSRSTNSLLQSEHIHFLPAVTLQKRGKLDESCLVYEHKPFLMTDKLLTAWILRGWWR